MIIPTRENLSIWTEVDDLIELLAAVTADQRSELEDAVAGLLDHADEDVRQEALRILCILWKAVDYHARAREAFQRDPSPEVRAAASYALAATATDATRSEDVIALIGALEDPREPSFVRGAAYDGLLILHRRPQFPTMQREFRPESDVDFGWIRSLKSAG